MKTKMRYILLLAIVITIIVGAGDAQAFLDRAAYDPVEDTYTFYTSLWIKVANITLVENTDKCLIDCHAKLEVYFYRGVEIPNFIDDPDNKITFERDNGKLGRFTYEPIKWSVQQLVGREETIPSQVPIYTTAPNGSREFRGWVWKDDVRTVNEWKDVRAIRGNAGDTNYYILRGKKGLGTRVEWFSTLSGIKLEEWAWWDTDWNAKRSLDISSEFFVNNFTIRLVLNSSNINYGKTLDSGDDLRFLDYDENEELGFWIETWVDGGTSIVWLHAPNLTANVNTSFFMYYNNTGASSTSDIRIAYLFGEDFRDDIGWSLSALDSIGDNMLSITGDSTATISYKNFTYDARNDTTMIINFTQVIEGGGGCEPEVKMGMADGFTLYTNDRQNSTAFFSCPSAATARRIGASKQNGTHTSSSVFPMGQAIGRIDKLLSQNLYIYNVSNGTTNILSTSFSSNTREFSANYTMFKIGERQVTGAISNITINQIRIFKRLPVEVKYVIGDESVNTLVSNNYNVTLDTVTSPVYETNNATYRLEVSINGTSVLFVNAFLFRDNIRFDPDSNITANNITTFLREITIGLVDNNVTNIDSKWNFTIFLENGSIFNVNSTTLTQEVNFAYIISNITVDNPTIVEGQTILANATVSKSTNNAERISMFFTHQSLNVTGKNISVTPTIERYSKSFSTGNVTEDTTVTVYGFINITFNDITKQRISIGNTSQFINLINISTACGDDFNLSLVLHNRDEQGQGDIRNNIDWVMDIWVNNKSNSKTFTFNAQQVFNTSVCIKPGNGTFQTDTIIEYGNSSYVDRNHFLINATITANTSNVFLYDLLDTEDTVFEVKVQDEFLVPQANVFITSQRYYIQNNSFLAVEMGRTGTSGLSTMKFEADAPDYKFFVQNSEGRILLSTSASKITCQEVPCNIILTIDGTNPFGETFRSGTENTFLFFDNQTKIIHFAFSDNGGLITTARLLVESEKLGREPIIICDQTVSASSGTILCNVTGQEGTFVANAFIGRSPTKFVKSIRVSLKEVGNILLGVKDSLILGAILVLTIAMIGIANIGLAIGVAIVGIWLVGFMGLLSVPALTLFGLLAIGVAIITHSFRGTSS